jgi:hypothetical protein
MVITFLLRKSANIFGRRSYSPNINPIMRRIAAHLAIAAIYLGSFAPLLVAEASTQHACCLRNGAHHCQGTNSNEPGFHAKNTACPFSSQFPPTSSPGLEPAKVSFASTTMVELLSHTDSDFRSLTSVRDLSARAPPDSLL